MELVDFVASLSIFRDMPPAIVRELVSRLEPKQLLAGEVLFHQGDPGNIFYIITSGKLRADLCQPGCTNAMIEDLGPGEFAGEMALLTGQPRSVTVSAMEDSQLLCLSRADFDRLAAIYPSLIAELTHKLLPRFQQIRINVILTRLFGQLDEATLRDLEKKLTWRRFACGEVLCQQGDEGDEMYIVVHGRLRYAVQDGGERRDLGEVGAGESIGEFALLAEDDSPDSFRSATIYAARSTEVIVINRKVFEDLLCQFPQALLKLTRKIIQRSRRTNLSTPVRIGAQVIAVVPLRPGGGGMGEFGRQLADSFSSLGSTLFLDAARFEQFYGKLGTSQTPQDHPANLLIDTWLDEREGEHRYVIYEATPTLDEYGQLTPWAQRCVEDADVVLLVGEGNYAAISGVETALARACMRSCSELVLVHPRNCPVPSGTSAWLAPRRTGTFAVQAHHHVRLGNPGDFRRLARRLSGYPIGLTLSGGGARGWAHLGAIRALEEANLEVDWVGGASMGAIMAAAYALDWPADRLYQMAVSFSNSKKLLDYTFPYASITATHQITTLLQNLWGDTQIEDTWRPYFCVSANLSRGEEQVHTDGLLWKIVRASMAFPAVFAPIFHEGCVLVDGGAANNLPVDRMREFCPTGTVIGVSLNTVSPVNHPYNFGPSLSGWQAILERLNPFDHKVKAPTLLDIVSGIVYSNNRYRLKEVWRYADLLIRVPVEAYNLLDFDKYAEMIEIGYKAAQEQVKGFKVKTP